MAPDISVLIASRDRRQLLIECLASVRKQTFTNYEIVLVNDGSVDGTNTLAHLVDTYYETPPIGVAHARNMALRLATGRYLYVLDSDDLLADNALELSLLTLEDTRADMVFSELLYLRGSTVVGRYGTRVQSVEEVLSFKRIPHGSSLMRRATLDVEYDESLPSAVDLDFLLRYMPGKIIRKTPKPVYYYRLHQGQMGWKPLQDEVARGIRERYRASLIKPTNAL